MLKKENLIKRILIYFAICIVSFSLCKINLFSNYFVFVVPFICFCFLNNKSYGVFSFLFSSLFLGLINKWFMLLMICVGVSFIFVSNFIKSSTRKLKLILCFYNFIVVFLLGVVSNVIYRDNMYLLSFFCGVIGYWVMYYFYDLYLSLKNRWECKLDSRISSFVFIFFGVLFLGLDIKIYNLDVSYIFLLFLSFVAVRTSIEVGCVYTLVMLAMLFFYKDFSYELLIFCGSFLITFFLSKVSKITLFFTYSFAVLFAFYYFNLDYLGGIDYLVASLLFVLVPSSSINKLSEVCYGSEAYIKRLKENGKSFNLKIANKIIKMEEVFSLVCEKIDIKDRIKKNDRKLLIEEVNLFSDLLKSFSNEIKSNYNFDVNYFVEREFYKYGLDLLGVNMSEDIFNNKIIEVDVRCNKKEVEELVVPLINKTFNNNFEIRELSYNDIFGYYSIVLVKRKRRVIKYGVSQKSFDKSVCGDSYLVYENDSKYVFALSDGMGVGESAKESSKLALDLFQKFMNIGFSLEQTLKSLNSILVEKYSKDNYSTLDLFIYDKLEDKYYICKNGASDSYLLNENKEIIKGNDLPLGIIDKKEYIAKEVNLSKGDLLFMVSDGVGELDMLKLEKLKNKNCQKISEVIVDMNNDINDDKTVFVIKVC